MSYFKVEDADNYHYMLEVGLTESEKFALKVMFKEKNDVISFIRKEIGSSIDWIAYCERTLKGNINYYNQFKNNLTRYSKGDQEDSYDYESLIFEYEASMREACDQLFGEGSYANKKNQIRENKALFDQVMKVVEAELIFCISKWKREYVLAYEEFNQQKQEFDKFKHPDSIVF